jgi:hypothetical protein
MVSRMVAPKAKTLEIQLTSRRGSLDGKALPKAIVVDFEDRGLKS